MSEEQRLANLQRAYDRRTRNARIRVSQSTFDNLKAIGANYPSFSASVAIPLAEQGIDPNGPEIDEIARMDWYERSQLFRGMNGRDRISPSATDWPQAMPMPGPAVGQDPMQIQQNMEFASYPSEVQQMIAGGNENVAAIVASATDSVARTFGKLDPGNVDAAIADATDAYAQIMLAEGGDPETIQQDINALVFQKLDEQAASNSQESEDSRWSGGFVSDVGAGLQAVGDTADTFVKDITQGVTGFADLLGSGATGEMRRLYGEMRAASMEGGSPLDVVKSLGSATPGTMKDAIVLGFEHGWGSDEWEAALLESDNYQRFTSPLRQTDVGVTILDAVEKGESLDWGEGYFAGGEVTTAREREEKFAGLEKVYDYDDFGALGLLPSGKTFSLGKVIAEGSDEALSLGGLMPWDWDLEPGTWGYNVVSGVPDFIWALGGPGELAADKTLTVAAKGIGKAGKGAAAPLVRSVDALNSRTNAGLIRGQWDVTSREGFDAYLDAEEGGGIMSETFVGLRDRARSSADGFNSDELAVSLRQVMPEVPDQLIDELVAGNHTADEIIDVFRQGGKERGGMAMQNMPLFRANAHETWRPRGGGRRMRGTMAKAAVRADDPSGFTDNVEAMLHTAFPEKGILQRGAAKLTPGASGGGWGPEEAALIRRAMRAETGDERTALLISGEDSIMAHVGRRLQNEYNVPEDVVNNAVMAFHKGQNNATETFFRSIKEGEGIAKARLGKNWIEDAHLYQNSEVGTEMILFPDQRQLRQLTPGRLNVPGRAMMWAKKSSAIADEKQTYRAFKGLDEGQLDEIDVLRSQIDDIAAEYDEASAIRKEMGSMADEAEAGGEAALAEEMRSNFGKFDQDLADYKQGMADTRTYLDDMKPESVKEIEAAFGKDLTWMDNDIASRFGRVVGGDIRKQGVRFGSVSDRGIAGTGAFAADWLMTKLWKRTKLLRAAWVTRVVAEEQLRIANIGLPDGNLDSLFRNPISYLGWAFGTKGDVDVLAKVLSKKGDNILAENPEFMGVLTRRLDTGGGQLDFAIKGTGWETIDRPTDVTLNRDAAKAYRDGLGHQLGVLRNDKVTRDLAIGEKSLDEVATELFENEDTLIRLRRANSDYAAEGMFDTREGVKQYVEVMADKLNYYTKDSKDLRHVVANGAMPDGRKMMNSQGNATKAYNDFLETNIPKGPQRVIGRKLDGDMSQSWWDQKTQGAMSAMMGATTDTLSRAPTFRQAYWRMLTSKADYLSSDARRMAASRARAAGLDDYADEIAETTGEWDHLTDMVRGGKMDELDTVATAKRAKLETQFDESVSKMEGQFAERVKKGTITQDEADGLIEFERQSLAATHNSKMNTVEADSIRKVQREAFTDLDRLDTIGRHDPQWVRGATADGRMFEIKDGHMIYNRAGGEGLSPAARAQAWDDALLEGAGIGKLEDVDQVAKGYALEKTNDLLFDLSDRSNHWDAMRLIFPFGEAYEEVLTRWGKGFAKRPYLLRRADQIYTEGQDPEFAETMEEIYANSMGEANGYVNAALDAGGPLAPTWAPRLPEELELAPEGKGFIHKDRNGSLIFNYPGSDWINKKILGHPIPFTGRLEGMNFIGDVWPGVGPVVQMPYQALSLHQNPSWDWLTNTVQPYGSLDSAWAEFLPSSFTTLVGGMMTRGEGTIANIGQMLTATNSEQTSANVVMDAFAYLMSTGEYQQTPEGSTEAMEEAKKLGSNALIFRGLMQLGGPTPTSPNYEWPVMLYSGGDKEDPDNFVPVPAWQITDLYRAYKDTYGVDGDYRFFEEHGSLLAHAVAGKTKQATMGGVVTQQGWDWVRRNGDDLSEYENILSLLAPHGGKYSWDAYTHAMQRGYREQLTPEQFKLAGEDEVAQAVYAHYRDEVFADVFLNGSTAEKRQARNELTRFSEQLKEDYPGWNSGELEGSMKRDDAIAMLEDAAADPNVVERLDPEFAAMLRDWFAVSEENKIIYEKYQLDQQRMGNDLALSGSPGAEYADEMQNWMMGEGMRMARGNEQFAYVWDRYLVHQFDHLED